jgi:hypothetical protein
MSKTEGEMFRYRFENETKNVLKSFPNLSCREQIVLIGPESALLDLIEMCSFDGPDLRTNSEVMVSFSVRCRDVCGTFVERFSFTVLTLLVLATPLLMSPIFVF